MRARFALAAELGTAAWQKVLFGAVMKSALAAGAARAAAAGAQRLLCGTCPTASGLAFRFPAWAAAGSRTFPALPARGFVSSLAPGEAARGEAMLFVGCVFDHVLPEVGRAAYETMRAGGAAVAVLRDASCCGLPAMAAGDWESARECAARNVARMREAAPQSIIFPCGSCLYMFRRNLALLFPEDHPLHRDAAWVAQRCVDYAEFMLSSRAALSIRPVASAAPAGTIGYHDPCHLSGTLGKGPQARELLRAAAGGAFAEMPGADLCCGLGGTFNLRDYPTSAAIGERKIGLAVRGGTAVVATACSGCLLQLRDMAVRVAPSLRVVHVAELVREALPGR